jgi:hypothetical protein
MYTEDIVCVLASYTLLLVTVIATGHCEWLHHCYNW